MLLTIPPARSKAVASRSRTSMNNPAKVPINPAMNPSRLSRHPNALAKVASIVVPGTLLRYCHLTAQIESARTVVVQASWMKRTNKVPSLPILV